MTFKFFLSTVIVIGIRVIASLNSGHDPVKYNYLLSLTALYFLLKTENVTRPVEAAGVSVEPHWLRLFTKALEGLDLKSLIRLLGY